MPKNIRAILNIFILSISIFLYSLAHAADKDIKIPFKPGEKFTFDVRWEFIKAGSAELRILPFKEVNGEKVFRFHMTAKTTKFIDTFYKIRDTYESFTTIDMGHSIHYRKKKEGHRKKDATVKFDWVKQEALYVSGNEKWVPIPIMPGSFDPLSIYYAFRLYDLKVGKEIAVPITDGKKCVEGTARVIKREKIKIEMGEFDSFLVEPETKDIGGVFAKSKDARILIWVTADKKKIPLKFKSKVIVGSFIAELTSVEGL